MERRNSGNHDWHYEGMKGSSQELRAPGRSYGVGDPLWGASKA